MVPDNFENPQSFLAESVFNYLAPSSAKNWRKLSAIAKRFPHHFIVRERVVGSKDRYLSTSRKSDYRPEVLATPRHTDSVVVATLVKEKLVTWAAIDWLADTLSRALGRTIYPEQVRHSGMKDRWAVTTQTIIIFGVTVDELRRINWSHTPGKAGFFLKDIRWHDGRQRLHPTNDSKRDRVFTEVVGTVVRMGAVSSAITTRESLIERARVQVAKALGRELRSDQFSLKGDGRETRLHITHVTASEIAAVKWDTTLGISLKDVRIYKSNALSKGDHRNNRFELKIVVKGEHTPDAVQEYLAPLMANLERRSHCLPNAINFQRLAARQLGHLHGYTLVTGDYKAPDGVHQFSTASEAALYRFLTEVSGRENQAAEQMRRDIEPHWLYDFDGMKHKLQRSYRQLNMSVEYKMVERLADVDRYRGDFQGVLRSMSEEVSMWVAAWHSWWWNHVLARKLPHWIREMDDAFAKGHPYNPLMKGIPVLVDTPQSRTYYGRLNYCREALAQMDKADSFVSRQFLKPRNNNTPWRKAFFRIDKLSYDVTREDVDGEECTVVNLAFDLPSGAYATTFLCCLFDLEEPNKNKTVADPDAYVPGLDEETE
jgi:tRNA(Glu) U13 pseudouridine synthase TruD